jgi:hypothetical protein
MVSFYTGLLTGLKKDIKDKEKFKQYGKTIADFMRFPYGSALPVDLLPKEGTTNEKYLEYVGVHISILDFIYERKPKIRTEIIDDDIALYTISNIELFDKSEDFDVHYYIASGVVEKIVSRFFPRVSCNVDNIDIKKRIVQITLKLN